MSIYATFPPSTTYEELDKAVQAIPGTPAKRPVGVRLKDGTYHIIGHIVKDEDCPQEVFDAALDMIVESTIEALKR